MKKTKIISATVACVMALGLVPVTAIETQIPFNGKSEYQQRFEEMYSMIKNPDNGYFSPDGAPYHSIETLICEAPDQGHESTSETASYYVWLEAMNGKFTGNFSGLEEAWDVIEDYYIPTKDDQPGQGGYNPASPATYAAEYPLPDYYPSELKFGLGVGQDPLYNELKTTYGTPQIYGMHWLIDCDNFYGYGQRGDGVSTPSYINTFQRGEQESTWETIPHPSWEAFNWGGDNGFLDLFTGDAKYSKQWRYTNAPDADARAVQAMYWADKYADEWGVSVDSLDAKASKMGDYLRYCLFDKYFMKVGAQGMTPGNGYDSCQYLMSWYYAWGGALPSDGNWAWRIGCSHCHAGYQNPMAAYILSTQEDFIPESQNAQEDWSDTLERQLEFYQWLQSDEGAIAGGATNSYNGSYEKYPAGTSTFYGMAYQENPVYHDPGSNTWFGMQAWTMQRVAELYYETGNKTAKKILDKWVAWANSKVQLFDDGTFAIPNKIDWEGQPDTWTGKATDNKNLHVDVVNYGTDLGVTGSLSNALIYYAAATQKYAPEQDYETYLNTAQQLLDRMWNLYKDDKGVAAPELREDYARFFEQKVYVPEGWSGTMANGDEIKPGVSFIDIRTEYEDDPMFQEMEAALESGKVPEFTYHRFWAQCEIAIANGVMATLFPEVTGDDTEITVDITSPEDGDEFNYTEEQTPIIVTADAEIEEGSSIAKVELYADGELMSTDTDAPYSFEFIPERAGADADGLKDIELIAKAVSNKNKVVSSEKVNISVQFKAYPKPTVSITEPEEGLTINTETEGKKVTVIAEASIDEGNVEKVLIYADGMLIGMDYGDTCEVEYICPKNYGPEPDGIVDVKFTAKAVSDMDVEVMSEPLTVSFILPLEPVTVVTDLKVNEVRYTGQATSNTLGSYIEIQNTGNESYDLSKLEVRYYFTNDGYNNLLFFNDNTGMNINMTPWYVSLGTTATFNPVVCEEDSADTYASMTFANSTYSLIASGKLGIQSRITNSTWQNFNQGNDYSFGGTDTIVVLYDGKVVAGRIPV